TFFVQKFTQRMRKKIERIPNETMAALTSYHWPGNIRELQNMIERSVTLSRGPVLEVPLAELKHSTQLSRDRNGASLEAVERRHILQTLRDSDWVIGGPTGAAARLGLKRTTLNTRIRKLGITRPTEMTR